jgi:GNAT superfamily N-acetyltransferase
MSSAGDELGLQRARTTLGRSARLWAGEGTHRVEDSWWGALSGADSVDYNVVCWHGADPAIVDGLGLIKEAGVPAVQMLAGPALAGAQQLVDAEWVCIGTTPVMALDLERVSTWADDPAVRRVDGARLADARDLIGETFDISPNMARAALPDAAMADPAVEVWSLVDAGLLKSCVAAVTVEGVLVFWSMATPPRYQRQGYGRRLLSAMFWAAVQRGTTWALCYASSQGEPLYRSIGFEVLEHWQMWSRPRWVLGRA